MASKPEDSKRNRTTKELPFKQPESHGSRWNFDEPRGARPKVPLNIPISRLTNKNRPNTSYFQEDNRNALKMFHADPDVKFNRDTKMERKYPMGYKDLKELETKTPGEVIFTIQTSHSGFKILLNDPELNNEKLLMCLRIISLACHCDHKESLKNFLDDLIKVHNSFLNLKLSKYLLDTQSNLGDNYKLQSMHYVLDLTAAFQKYLPEVSLLTTQMILPYAKVAITRLTESLGQGRELLTLIRDQETKMNHLLDNYNTIRCLNVKYTDTAPNDFRTIPIFPDRKDLLTNERPFLRPNIVDGRYVNVNHYLDVQFRLLREDFIRPLREGIASYLEDLKNKTRRRQTDIKIYEGVRIIQTTLGNDGIAHLVHFNAHVLRNVDWDKSKRLIYGALVCLTPDNLETIYFGTVSNRQVPNLNKGEVEIKFEDHADILKIQKLTFTMIETEAYFEAFRHVLTVLQNVDEDTFPLKEHIVELRKTIDPPEYLNEKSVYCFQNTIVESDYKCHENHVQTEQNVIVNLLLSHLAAKKKENTSPKLVTLFDDKTWPTDKEMNLNPSQYLALKSALKNKISITQGPPGTGKTHVGLKIMQLLLHNSNIWNESSSNPILVVCYTNHALDQFLEGVLKYTYKLIRIGGKSESDIIKPYNIQVLKKERRKFHNQLSGTKKDIESILKKIIDKEQLSLTAETLLLTEKELRNVMEIHNYRSFVEYLPWDIKQSDVVNGKIMATWLGLKEDKDADFHPKKRKKRSNNCQLDKANPVEARMVENAEPQFHEGHDVGYIINQRYDDEEFDNNDRVVLFHQSELQDGKDWKIIKGKGNGQDVIDISESLKAYRPFIHQRQCNRFSIWRLNMDDRWRLYKTWVTRLVEQIRPEIEELKMEYEKKVVTLRELRMEEDSEIAKSALVIGMTTTGAAKHRHLISSIRPKIVIVEEAAEVLEAHIVTSLSPHTQHLILIGDHQQLRPNPVVYDLAKKFKLEISLFERLINNGMPYVRLGIQHRMKPDISRLLVPHIYQDLEDHPSVFNYEEILGLNKSVYFINHAQQEFQTQDSTSRVNRHEAEFIVKLCQYILLQGYKPSQVTILTTYAGQLHEINRLLTGQLKEVKAAVVDNYQGEENDVILLSFVRSNDQGSIGFLKTENRVCVALSRAKKGLFCIGNFEMFAQESALWTNITNELVKMSAIGPSLDLRCQLHKTSVKASGPLNFDDVPDGGCALPCDYRLECGHVCPKRCHPLDRGHKENKCLKLCERSCQLGHKCKKVCFVKCGDCLVKVAKTVPKCGHESIMECYVDVEEYQCLHRCPKVLQCGHESIMECYVDVKKYLCLRRCPKVFGCGHECPKLCHERCTPCEVIVSKVLPQCGHEADMRCCDDVKSFVCQKPCTKILPCEHQCPKRCSDLCGGCQVVVNVTGLCHHVISTQCQYSSIQDKLAKYCQAKCNKTLDCGHKCYLRCGIECQTRCNVPVEVKSPCGHVIKSPCHLPKDSKSLLEFCPRKCKTLLKCGHQCTGTCSGCFQGRLHVICKVKCQKILICGHACESLCSSSCPPCSKPCENLCSHGQCPELCGYPCLPCTELCNWQCNHLKCTKRCDQPCGRPPCNRPCTKTLKCGHPCVGMCGEPCPKLCRICDKEKLQTIFFGNEKEPKSRFLQLEDCNHVFEIKGLTKWILEQASSEIKVISCPVCKTPIRRINLRFGREINRNLERIELVKQKMFGQMNENRQVQRKCGADVGKILTKLKFSKYIFEIKIYDDKIEKQLQKMNGPLLGRRILSKGTLVTLENHLNILKALNKIEEMFSKKYSLGIRGKDTEDYVKFSGTKIMSIMEQSQYETLQVTEDIGLEIRRLRWMANFNHDSATIISDEGEKAKLLFEKISNKLMDFKPMTEEDFQTLNSSKQDLKKLIGAISLDENHEETLQILKAMGPTQGHWYSCPNRHVYWVTECGRPTMEGHCNECQSDIEGESEVLRANNKPANKKPASVNKKPASVNKKPASVNKKPASVNKKPASVNNKPASVNNKPASVNNKPASVNNKPASVNNKPASVNNKPASVNNKPASVNNKPASVNNKPASVNNKPASVNNKPASVNNKPASVNNKPASVNNKPASVNNKPASVNNKPATVNNKPATVNNKPATVKNNNSATFVNNKPATVNNKPATFVNNKPATFVNNKPATFVDKAISPTKTSPRPWYRRYKQ